jgi:hypothetical protein
VYGFFAGNDRKKYVLRGDGRLDASASAGMSNKMRPRKKQDNNTGAWEQGQKEKEFIRRTSFLLVGPSANTDEE